MRQFHGFGLHLASFIISWEIDAPSGKSSREGGMPVGKLKKSFLSLEVSCCDMQPKRLKNTKTATSTMAKKGEAPASIGKQGATHAVLKQRARAIGPRLSASTTVEPVDLLQNTNASVSSVQRSHRRSDP